MNWRGGVPLRELPLPHPKSVGRGSSNGPRGNPPSFARNPVGAPLPDCSLAWPFPEICARGGGSTHFWLGISPSALQGRSSLFRPSPDLLLPSPLLGAFFGGGGETSQHFCLGWGWTRRPPKSTSQRLLHGENLGGSGWSFSESSVAMRDPAKEIVGFFWGEKNSFIFFQPAFFFLSSICKQLKGLSLDWAFFLPYFPLSGYLPTGKRYVSFVLGGLYPA